MAEVGITRSTGRHSWYKADLIVTCTPGNYKDPFIAEPVLVVGGPLPYDQRHRFQPQAPGLPPDLVDARYFAGLQAWSG